MEDIKVLTEAVEPAKSPNYLRLKVHGFENIIPVYPVADITMTFELKDSLLGESEKVHVSSNKFVATNYELSIPCNLSLPADIDTLISYPITITVTETEKEVNMSHIEIVDGPHLEEKKEVKKGLKGNSEITVSSSKSKSGSKLDKKIKDKKGKGKEKKESKFKSAKNYFDTKQEKEPLKGPQTVGVAMLDLLPIFLGRTEFSEELYVRPTKKFSDEKAIAAEDLPKLQVTVTMEGEPLNTQKATVFHISVESIFNLPSFLGDRYNYHLSIMLPINCNGYEPMGFPDGTFTINGDFIRYQFWPPSSEENKPRLESSYRIDNDFSEIVNTNGISIDAEVVTKPRIEYNTIKRIYLDEINKESIFRHIQEYRKILIEIYVVTGKIENLAGSSNNAKKAGKKEKNDKGKGSSTSKSRTTSTSMLDGSAEYLHLMAIANVDQLLYPGEKTCRVACPIRTYHKQEILNQTGVKRSHFRPQLSEISVNIPAKDKESKDKKGDKKKEKPAKGSKGSKGSDKGKKSKGKKEDTGESKSSGINLAEKLPPPPVVEVEPSVQMLNDKGEASFLLIEFCFMKPLYPKRELEDLTNKLNTIIKCVPALPKLVISSSVAQEIYNETIRQLMSDMNDQYLSFLEERSLCECPQTLDFLKYLQQTGVYQTYVMSVTRALSTLIPEKYRFELDSTNKFSVESQNFIKLVHADVMQQINKVINEISCNLGKVSHTHMVKNEDLLLYAKEACEMGEYKLAERYFLERICSDEKNANVWFDFAIFHMELNDFDHAIYCLKEALSHDSAHHYSLLMYGLILFDKGKQAEAETCLMTLTLMHPRWPEGWGGLYIFYYQVNNIEGTELALHMAQKYFDVPNSIQEDYFSATDDLAWSSQFCMGNIYSRTAVLFLKLRLLDQAEKVITLITGNGVREYLMGVLSYYTKNFEHALQHLECAKDIIGLNYGVCALIGHCFVKINNHCNAITLYEMILPMYNRPDDLHLAYLFAAMCYDTTGEWQNARKLALLACKYSPTPQTWMHAGSYYFKQNDLLSSEQCLIQANLCDNRLPEPWAYLALINAHLGKLQETELSLTQAKKFSPPDYPLIENVEKILKSMDLE